MKIGVQQKFVVVGALTVACNCALFDSAIVFESALLAARRVFEIESPINSQQLEVLLRDKQIQRI